MFHEQIPAILMPFQPTLAPDQYTSCLILANTDISVSVYVLSTSDDMEAFWF